ncbi:MAG: DUF5522 domain-containing protein [Myxococcota bacterium]
MPPDDRPPAPPWADVHRAAVEAGRPTYRDPATGYTVMTEVAHLARGTCCGSGCRHCPFDHDAVPDAIRAKVARPVTVRG